MVQWLFLLVILVGLAILVFTRQQKLEGFGSFKDDSMRFANSQNKYFQNVVDKALFVNPGLTYSNLNAALASPDLYVPTATKKDYTPYLMVDPENAFSENDRKFCRGAVHPRNLPPRKPGSTIGCGWYFVEDPDTPSVGVLGTVDGPSFSDLPGGGVWMWDVIGAGEKEDIKACKRITSCDVIDVEGVKGVCGFCATNGYAVPINGSGQVKYPDSEDGSCGEPTKNSKEACAVPIVQGITTEDGVECGTAGRPSSDMTLRLYTKAECDTLGGVHNTNGQCTRSDGGSYSIDCSELNVPAPPPVSVCTPNARGILSRECLKGIALSLGYSKQGGVLRQLMMSRISLGATDTDAIKVLQQAGVQVPDSILGTGAITVEAAGALYKKLSDAAFKGATNQIKQAAKWFTVGTNEFDICDYKVSQRGPFSSTCLQRAFRTKGCQASGSAYPTERSAANYSTMTWGELNSKFTDLFNTMNSSDPDAQDAATANCLGLTHARKPMKPCDWTQKAVEGTWTPDPGAGNRLSTISISDSNFIMGTNTAQGIYGNRDPKSGSYSQYPGALVQVDTKGPNLIVGVNAGGLIYQWINNNWTRIGVSASWVSIGVDGTIVCVNNSAGTLWRYLGSVDRWENIPGNASQISVGDRGTMWCVNRGGLVFKWTGNNWANIPGSLTRVAVSSSGKVAGVNGAGQIFVYSPALGTWRLVAGSAKQISVSDSHMAITTADSRIFFMKF